MSVASAAKPDPRSLRAVQRTQTRQTVHAPGSARTATRVSDSRQIQAPPQGSGPLSDGSRSHYSVPGRPHPHCGFGYLHFHKPRPFRLPQPLLPLVEMPSAQTTFTAKRSPHSGRSDSVRKPTHPTLTTLPSCPVSSLNCAASHSPRQDAVRIALTEFLNKPAIDRRTSELPETSCRPSCGWLRASCGLDVCCWVYPRKVPSGDNPDRAVSEAISAASADQPAFALAFTARDDYVEILKFFGRQILKFLNTWAL